MQEERKKQMAGNDDGIEDLQLSAETLKVLQNFYKEEHQRLLNELSTNHNDFEEKWVRIVTSNLLN